MPAEHERSSEHKGYKAVREGFRMPAEHERSSEHKGYKAGVRKPPMKEPAGAGEQSAVYGDLARQRRCREMVLLRLLRTESR
jgi:hypothetical protein